MSNHNDKNLLNSGDLSFGDNPEPRRKNCNRCGVEKDEYEFHKSEGYSLDRHPTCKACRKEQARDRYIDNPFKVMHRTKKYWSAKNGVDYNLTEDYLRSIWTGVCPITGQPLTIAQSIGNHSNSAWLDRINPDMGYIQGNVAFISGRMNRIKYNATLTELELLVEWMRKVQRLSPSGSTSQAIGGGSGKPLDGG